MQRKAMFPGSFDPFTRGHKAVVDEALKLFDKVVIAIGHNTQKRGLLTVERRKALIEQAYKGEERVEVIAYSSLTGDEARRIGATVIIRSVRNAQDFEYERNIAEANKQLCGIETVLLYTRPEYAHISSSLVRELHSYHKDITPYLP